MSVYTSTCRSNPGLSTHSVHWVYTASSRISLTEFNFSVKHTKIPNNKIEQTEQLTVHTIIKWSSSPPHTYIWQQLYSIHWHFVFRICFGSFCFVFLFFGGFILQVSHHVTAQHNFGAHTLRSTSWSRAPPTAPM